MPKEQLYEYLVNLQSLLTIQIITGQSTLKRIEEGLKFIDLVWRVNKHHPAEDQIHPREFHNDAINNMVDLK